MKTLKTPAGTFSRADKTAVILTTLDLTESCLIAITGTKSVDHE